MSDTTQTNAMAEIALALAMGFFSIMVLMMVSMGSGVMSQSTSAELDQTPIEIGKTSKPKDSSQLKEVSQKVKSESLVIYFEGQYLDSQLQPLNMADIRERQDVVLAVSPELSMSKALSVREALKAGDITVVVLDDAWMARLTGERS